MKRPYFIVIGGERCATTWLHKVLEAHPDVFVPELKETNYFVYPQWPEEPLVTIQELFACKYESNDTAETRRRLRLALAQLKARFGTIEDYFSLFESENGKICGEISPAYACLDRANLERLQKHLPDVKLIFLLRDPVDRFLSSARLKAVQLGRDDADEVALEMLNWPAQIRQSSYTETLNLYEEYFPHSRIKVAFFDDIVRDPKAVTEDILGYLGKDPVLECFEVARLNFNHAPGAIASQKCIEAIRQQFLDEYRALEVRFPGKFSVNYAYNIAGVPSSDRFDEVKQLPSS